MRFHDRDHAGRLLAALPELRRLTGEPVAVVAIPRGGVPVALPLARALDAPLSVVCVRKVVPPDQPEYAVGAVAQGGEEVVDPRAARAAGMDQDTLRGAAGRARRELERRAALLAAYTVPDDLSGVTAVVVDDGMATGLTDLAAVRAVRRRGPARVVLAVPVAAAPAVRTLRTEADDVVCALTPGAAGFAAVGRWYEDFSPVEDEDVLAILRAAR